ncbi:hypothetical protein [Microscilla marina]|uniref:Integral membrane protein n=1 Tax=Microscilla marina ATCC 23134 TaxID=313606 RepID=A1ZKZ8_MICM2|nr:hypothetical protein [Microscilla marina]EAY28964.1 hypothetical protein M23134_00118 [Microscilla marina ATCC 23134]
MTYEIKNPVILKKILWTDFVAGSSTGVIGLMFSHQLTNLLGLPYLFIVWVSAITLVYALNALGLALMKNTIARLVLVLVYANWLWALISVGLLCLHFGNASILGKIVLVLQIIVVGGLAFAEGRQLTKVKHKAISDH